MTPRGFQAPPWLTLACAGPAWVASQSPLPGANAFPPCDLCFPLQHTRMCQQDPGPLCHPLLKQASLHIPTSGRPRPAPRGQPPVPCQESKYTCLPLGLSQGWGRKLA